MTKETLITIGQIGGFVVGVVGWFTPGKLVIEIGFSVHFVADVFFYLNLKRKGLI
jgi:hypothetical protein